MTLREFIQFLAENDFIVLFFFLLLPFSAWLAGVMSQGEGNLSPWKYFYSALVYLACIPGIFAVALSIYLFLFERRSIFDTDMYTQILPVVSMIASILIMRKSIDFNQIPGFDKISGLMTIIAATLMIMWFVDKTRIVIFSYMPIWQLGIIFLVLLVVIRWGWSRLVR